MLAGLELVASVACVEACPPVLELRAWRQRRHGGKSGLALRSVTRYKPSSAIYLVGGHTAYGHPVVIQKIKEAYALRGSEAGVGEPALVPEPLGVARRGCGNSVLREGGSSRDVQSGVVDGEYSITALLPSLQREGPCLGDPELGRAATGATHPRDTCSLAVVAAICRELGEFSDWEFTSSLWFTSQRTHKIDGE